LAAHLCGGWLIFLKVGRQRLDKVAPAGHMARLTPL
jgi:hypothetical protein